MDSKISNAVVLNLTLGVRKQLTEGTQVAQNWYAKSKKVPKQAHFRFGGTQRGTIMIWGYAEEENLDLGVRKY